MVNIKFPAVKLLRATNGVITYSSLKKYIKSNGFVLVNMNTERGDRILKNFHIYERCIGNDGKTIGAEGVDFVVIDDMLSAEDKVRVMLHEIYHMNNHCDSEIIRDATRIQRDNEAETFVYEVFRLQKYKFLYSRFAWIFAVCTLIITLALSGIYLGHSAARTQQAARAEAYTVATPAPQSTPAEELQTNKEANVYTLPGSKVYHKDTCYHLNINNASALTIPEAEKIGLRPCKDCDPE